MENPPAQLGDLVHTALAKVGITRDRVEAVARWIGKKEGSCGCEQRQQKLNLLSSWARRVLKGRLDRATEYLSIFLGEEQ